MKIGLFFLLLFSCTAVYSNQQDYILYNVGLAHYLKGAEQTHIASTPKYDYYIVDSVQINLADCIKYVKKEIRKKSKRLARRFENDTSYNFIDFNKLKIDDYRLYPCNYDFCSKVTSPNISIIYLSKIYYDSGNKYAAFILGNCKLYSGTISLLIIQRLKHNRYSVTIKNMETLSR